MLEVPRLGIYLPAQDVRIGGILEAFLAEHSILPIEGLNILYRFADEAMD